MVEFRQYRIDLFQPRPIFSGEGRKLRLELEEFLNLPLCAQAILNHAVGRVPPRVYIVLDVLVVQIMDPANFFPSLSSLGGSLDPES